MELSSDLGIECNETHLRPFDLATADEAFATATSYCIQPITKAQGRVIGTGQPGPLTARLLAAWSDRVGLDIAGQAREQATAQQGSLVRP